MLWMWPKITGIVRSWNEEKRSSTRWPGRRLSTSLGLKRAWICMSPLSGAISTSGSAWRTTAPSVKNLRFWMVPLTGAVMLTRFAWSDATE